MKTLQLSILILLATGLSQQAFAQVTAVMEARVRVISGISLTTDKAPVINLSDLDSSVNSIEAGSFTLVAKPGIDIQVSTMATTAIQNEEGESIEIGDLKFNETVDASGTHRYTLNGTMKNLHNSRGNYKGMLTTVIEYL